jgi:hypothetical protein
VAKKVLSLQERAKAPQKAAQTINELSRMLPVYPENCIKNPKRFFLSEKSILPDAFV